MVARESYLFVHTPLPILNCSAVGPIAAGPTAARLTSADLRSNGGTYGAAAGCPSTAGSSNTSRYPDQKDLKYSHWSVVHKLIEI